MRASTIRTCLSTLEACTRDVKRWFAENDLLLNADKSEVMMIGTPAQLRAASTVNTVPVADANLTLSSKLKSLGVILDSRLSFDAYVAVVCKTCNYHIWALRHIRRLHSTWYGHWPAPSSAQGWITVIQSCTEHLSPKESSKSRSSEV